MLKGLLARCLLCANLAFVLSEAVWAQDLDTGRLEFLSKCAMCHGADGKGAGPLGAKLKVKPSNLTTLTKMNKGVFPQWAVYETVDGRKATRSHRISEMPIWGCRHGSPPAVAKKSTQKRTGRRGKRDLSERPKQQTVQNRPVAILDLACDPEPVIRSRIRAVVDYLRQIQEK